MAAWNAIVSLAGNRYAYRRTCLMNMSAFARASATGTRRASLSSFFILLAVLVGMPVDAARPASVKYVNRKIETQIIGSVRLTNCAGRGYGPLVWCFKDKPSFVYVRGTQVMRMTFGESLHEVVDFGRALDGSSLQCSDDGSVMAVLSQDGA